MRNYLYLAIFSIFLVGCSSDTLSVKETKDVANSQQIEQPTSQDTTQQTEYVDKRIITMYHNLIDRIHRLPIYEEDLVFKPYGLQSVLMTEDGQISGIFHYKVTDLDTYEFFDTMSVNVSSDENMPLNNFSQHPKHERIWMNEQASEVAYKKDGYLIQLRPHLYGEKDVAVMDFLVERALIDIKTQSSYANEFFSFVDQLQFPTYLLNEEKPLRFEISTSFKSNMPNSLPEPLTYSIGNEDVQVTLTTADELVDYGFYADILDCCMEPMTIAGFEGFADQNELLGFYYEKDTWKIYIRPGQDVDESTGRVTPKYHDNWFDTIEKIVQGIK